MIERFTVFQGGSVTLLDHITDANQTNATIDDIDEIEVKTFDEETGELINQFAPVVASTMFDTMQLGSGWTKNKTGFNSRIVADEDNFPSGDTIVRIEVTYTFVGGYVVRSVFQGVVVRIYS